MKQTSSKSYHSYLRCWCMSFLCQVMGLAAVPLGCPLVLTRGVPLVVRPPACPRAFPRAWPQGCGLHPVVRQGMGAQQVRLGVCAPHIVAWSAESFGKWDALLIEVRVRYGSFIKKIIFICFFYTGIICLFIGFHLSLSGGFYQW